MPAASAASRAACETLSQAIAELAAGVGDVVAEFARGAQQVDRHDDGAGRVDPEVGHDELGEGQGDEEHAVTGFDTDVGEHARVRERGVGELLVRSGRCPRRRAASCSGSAAAWANTGSDKLVMSILSACWGFASPRCVHRGVLSTGPVVVASATGLSHRSVDHYSDLVPASAPSWWPAR